MRRPFAILFTGLAAVLSGQDLHFTQSLEAPALLNPALTGSSGVYRAGLNYRDQWRSMNGSFRTFGGSFEMRAIGNQWEQVDKHRGMTFRERTVGRLALGFSFYSDEAGDGKLGSLASALSVSSFIPIGGHSFIAAGGQAGLVQRKVVSNNLVFPDQYNGSQYAATNPTRERLYSETMMLPDYSAGVMYLYSRTARNVGGNRQMHANVGASVCHLTEPAFRFLGAQGKVAKRYVAHGMIFTDLPGSAMAVEIGAVMQRTGPSTELSATAILMHIMNTDSRYTGYVRRAYFGYGAIYRHNDAIAPVVRISWREQYQVQLAYDVTISRLSLPSSGRGGLEISLKYTPPKGFLYENRK